MTALKQALDYLEGARFENYSGQIIAEHADKNKDFIVCDFTCECSEVASKNADEYGEVFVTVLNGAARLAAAVQAAIDFYAWHMAAIPSAVLEELPERRAALQKQLEEALQ